MADRVAGWLLAGWDWNLEEPVGVGLGEPIWAVDRAPPLDTEKEAFKSAQAILVWEYTNMYIYIYIYIYKR